MANINPAPAYVEYILDEPPPPTPKKKRLTKAERDELKQKALQEFKILEITELLKRELELSRKSSLRGREMWTQMCRQIKLVQMKEELQSWEVQTNRILTQKDEKVTLLLDTITETEEIHKRSFGTQLQVMDYLTGILKAFHDSARLRYETQASEMLHDFYDEGFERTQIEDGFQRNCENVMHATNLIVEQTLNDDFQIFLDKRDEGVNEEILKRYRLRDSVSLKLNRLHGQLLQFLGSLRDTSLDARKYERLNALMERQRTFVNESQKLNDTEGQNTRLQQDLQEELARVGIEGQRKINDLKLEHVYFVDLRKNIEKQMKLYREATHEKLKILTTECYGICKKYQKLQKYGELLLSLSANCRKLQTESEKVVSWCDFQEPPTRTDSAEDYEEFVLQALDLKSHIDLNEDEMKAQMDLMRNFWRRQALAEAQVITLEDRKRQLTKENQHYINTIKSLSKADNVNDLQETLRIQCVMDEEPTCPGQHNPFL